MNKQVAIDEIGTYDIVILKFFLKRPMIIKFS